MFIQECFIRNNSPEIRKRLKYLGYEICRCALFDNADWLDTYPERNSVHGVGYWDETFPEYWNKEKEITRFLEESNETNTIDCGDNENIFYAIAAMRDDTDINQWFIDDFGNWFLCEYDNIMKYYTAFPLDGVTPRANKATVEQILEYFKK